MNLKKLLIIFLPATMLMATGNANEYLEQARKIHEKIVTIDTHTDTPMLLGRNDFDLGRRGDPNNRGGKVDFPRMAEGGLDAAFFAVFLGQGESTPEAYAVAKERALTTFDLIHNALEANKDVAGLALMPEDALRLKKEGKRAIYIGLENGYPIGEDLSIGERILQSWGPIYYIVPYPKQSFQRQLKRSKWCTAWRTL
jgi:membrane dipeptidase